MVSTVKVGKRGAAVDVAVVVGMTDGIASVLVKVESSLSGEAVVDVQPERIVKQIINAIKGSLSLILNSTL